MRGPHIDHARVLLVQQRIGRDFVVTFFESRAHAGVPRYAVLLAVALNYRRHAKGTWPPLRDLLHAWDAWAVREGIPGW